MRDAAVDALRHWLGRGPGNLPQIKGVLIAFLVLHLDGPERLPVAHVEIVRDDACTRPQLAHELRPQSLIHVVRQIERHDSGVREVGLEQVVGAKRHPVADAGLPRQLRAVRHQPGIDLDADPARAEITRGRDHDTPVARAQVVDDVVGLDAGELQHLGDDVGRGLDVGDIGAGGETRGGTGEHDANQRGEEDRTAPSRSRRHPHRSVISCSGGVTPNS